MKRKERLAEYRGATPDQLQMDLRELEKNLFHLRFQSATDRLETPSEIRRAKRDIARILTVMTQTKTKAAQTKAAQKETVRG